MKLFLPRYMPLCLVDSVNIHQKRQRNVSFIAENYLQIFDILATSLQHENRHCEVILQVK